MTKTDLSVPKPKGWDGSCAMTLTPHFALPVLPSKLATSVCLAFAETDSLSNRRLSSPPLAANLCC